MHRINFFVLCGSALAVTAHAASKWPSIGTFAVPSGGTAIILLDVASMTRHGGVWTARQKTLFSSPQKTAAGLSFRSELELYAYDCAADRTALSPMMRPQDSLTHIPQRVGSRRTATPVPNRANARSASLPVYNAFLADGEPRSGISCSQGSARGERANVLLGRLSKPASRRSVYSAVTELDREGNCLRKARSRRQ